MAQKRAFSEYLAAASSWRSWIARRAPFLRKIDPATSASLARSAVFALALGAAAAVILEFAVYLGEVGANSAAQLTQPGAASISDGARRWSELTDAQRLSVLAALATIVAVVFGTVALARKRAEARWLAANHRRKLARSRPGEAAPETAASPLTHVETGRRGLTTRLPRMSAVRTSAPGDQDAAQSPQTAGSTLSPAPRSASDNSEIDLSAYLAEVKSSVRAEAAPLKLRSAASHVVGAHSCPPTWRTAHARRRRRMARLAGETLPVLSLEDRADAMRNRIEKFAGVQTARRKSGDLRAALH